MVAEAYAFQHRHRGGKSSAPLSTPVWLEPPKMGVLLRNHEEDSTVNL